MTRYTLIGFIVGLVLPLLTAFGFYRYGIHNGLSITEFFSWFVEIKYASSLMAVSALSDLAIFMGLAYSNKMQAARGVFMATVLWALVVIVLKFLVQ